MELPLANLSWMRNAELSSHKSIEQKYIFPHQSCLIDLIIPHHGLITSPAFHDLKKKSKCFYC